MSDCVGDMFSRLLIPCLNAVSVLLLGRTHRSETHWWLMYIMCDAVVSYMVWIDVMTMLTSPLRSADVLTTATSELEILPFLSSWSAPLLQ